jgi:nucleotidyltransferase AbiEii toxin of type IV toxin-antitoxin system
MFQNSVSGSITASNRATALVDAALPVCARYGLGVAGGYAVKAHGLVERPSEDIDFATETAAPIEEIVAALAAAYRSVGFEVQVLDAEGRKGHLLVTFPFGRTYRVHVLKEPMRFDIFRETGQQFWCRLSRTLVNADNAHYVK